MVFFYSALHFDKLFGLTSILSLCYLLEIHNYFSLVIGSVISIRGMKVVATAIISGSVPKEGVKSCPFRMQNLKTFHCKAYVLFPDSLCLSLASGALVIFNFCLVAKAFLRSFLGSSLYKTDQSGYS